MNWMQRVRLLRADAKLDAFFRLRCDQCDKAAVFIREDANSIYCKECGWEKGQSYLALQARKCHCHVCYRVCACVGGTHDAVQRCIGCEIEWEASGRPLQRSRKLVQESYPCNLTKLPALIGEKAYIDMLARYQIHCFTREKWRDYREPEAVPSTIDDFDDD